MVGTTKKKAANNLRAWREHARISQTELADRINTTPGVISELESGRTQLSEKWLRRLAPHLGTTPGWLLDHRPDDIDAETLALFLRIPEERKREAQALLRVLLPPTGTE